MRDLSGYLVAISMATFGTLAAITFLTSVGLGVPEKKPATAMASLVTSHTQSPAAAPTGP